MDSNIHYKSTIKIKNPGQTMSQFINNIKKDYEGKMCYSGRLDPMARGKVIVLFDDECKQVESYNKKSKTYQFEIIIGLQTKSDDPLGELEKFNLECISIDKVNNIKTCIESYLEKLFNQDSFYQKFHNYSSKKVKGVPLWLHSQNQENQYLEKEKHLVSIYDYELKEIKSYDYQEWKDKIIKLIDTIDKNCNFNQENIIKQWNKSISKNIYSIPVNLTVSSGFYVRQLVRDLSNVLNFPLMVYDINRTEIYI